MARHEDTSQQEGRLATANADLHDALAELSGEAALSARYAKRGRPVDVDLGPLYAAVNWVRRAEEAVDVAKLDLATAQGEDA